MPFAEALQAVKSGKKHERTGTTGINLVLDVLYQEAMKLHRRAK
jgi:hypothetical protein